MWKRQILKVISASTFPINNQKKELNINYDIIYLLIGIIGSEKSSS